MFWVIVAEAFDDGEDFAEVVVRSWTAGWWKGKTALGS